ncbi:MAG TPA: hypothetical protein VFB62_14495, partial [Polyangiaceae bacterium]|nr:hypothetical protein [Polyangiaceae bacterium]
MRLSPAALLVACCLASRAAAQPEEEETYSPYEQETLEEALKERKARVDPAPQGKRIVDVDIVVLDVIEQRDPLPNFLNIFHANTRDYVIERELLFGRDQLWEQELVDESERNLRGLRQESLVMIVPLATKDEQAVKALVIVKDVWSLRLNSDY